MKRLAFAVLMLAAGMASANELGDAEKALRAKEYDKALPIYTKLANAGNAEAQFRLGEMYWYGDGAAVDMAKSQAWLQKAAAGGHGGAKETLDILKQREQRAADIAFWTSGYKGEDLVSGKYACPAPKIPTVSKTNDEINRIQAEIATWETCYNDFVASVNQVPPGVKRIPADVVKLMSPKEVEQAGAHVDDATVNVISRRQAEALAFTGDRDAWFTSTQQFVADANGKAESGKRLLEEEQRRLREENETYQRNNQKGASFNMGGKK
ncbi:sel1 repeat family protein [Massilia aerilata]|uniref:Sel1 repeat family protein n=1 Tax=Massilia aerilata TaxID=453817 RepID=A0ABW0RYE0_9BURK